MFDVKTQRLLVQFEEPMNYRIVEALQTYKAESLSLVLDPDTHELWGLEIPVRDDDGVNNIEKI
jgi:hypothetical protein